MRRGADEKGRDGNDEEKGGSPRHRQSQTVTAPPPPRHSTPQAVTGSHRQSPPRHSTLEVAPENPPHATHFLKENANGLANKLRGPSLPPASILDSSGVQPRAVGILGFKSIYGSFFRVVH